MNNNFMKERTKKREKCRPLQLHKSDIIRVKTKNPRASSTTAVDH
jgi:hypothetical protein